MFLLTACAEISRHKKATKLSLAVLPFAVFQFCTSLGSGGKGAGFERNLAPNWEASNGVGADGVGAKFPISETGIGGVKTYRTSGSKRVRLAVPRGQKLAIFAKIGNFCYSLAPISY